MISLLLMIKRPKLVFVKTVWKAPRAMVPATNIFTPLDDLHAAILSLLNPVRHKDIVFQVQKVDQELLLIPGSVQGKRSSKKNNGDLSSSA